MTSERGSKEWKTGQDWISLISDYSTQRDHNRHKTTDLMDGDRGTKMSHKVY